MVFQQSEILWRPQLTLMLYNLHHAAFYIPSFDSHGIAFSVYLVPVSLLWTAVHWVWPVSHMAINVQTISEIDSMY